MKRRHMLHALPAAVAGAAALGGAGAAGAHAEKRGAARTFVLVHGAWHGGWCWRDVADRLRAAGHRVWTPTQTGLGERAHLLSKAVTIDTFVDDIANVLRFERLEDVVLVGHSFGGLAVSGVADRHPQLLRHLVYLDALMVPGGQSAFQQLPGDVVGARLKAAEESSGGVSLPAPPASAFGLTKEEDQRQIADRLTPHPLNTYTSDLKLRHPVGNGVARTYIVCTSPMYPALAKSRAWVKEQGWPVLELATGHDAMVSAPAELAAMLAKLAG